MFEINWLWPVLFLDIVIITPFVEELLFRHLLIHELGKKLMHLSYVILQTRALTRHTSHHTLIFYLTHELTNV
jgi:membrane protease YdiL (CAAX protease family)